MQAWRNWQTRMVQVHVSQDSAGSSPAACTTHARVAELADAPDSKSGSRKGVRVRVPPWAPKGSAIPARKTGKRRLKCR